MMFYFFFFNDTATTEIYTLSLHDALPISRGALDRGGDGSRGIGWNLLPVPQGSASGSVRGGVSGSGHGVRDHRADHRPQDRKSTRLNSSHSQISYAVFCLKKKKIEQKRYYHREYILRDGER